MTCSSHEPIPNNVNLSQDRRLARQMERWRTAFLEWWSDAGPQVGEASVYLRTAVSANPDGWAHYSHVRLSEYRWGIFFAPRDLARTISFGEYAGRPAWQEVPEGLRDALFRIVVSQSDTEPAAVEQQRRLGRIAPSLYDLRNLLQVSVEEGRHMWSMVYLLQRYFGAPGRYEVDRLMERRSGDSDRPRLLDIFNERLDDWLSFFLFTAFADRDGKYQLGALAESGFDPLSRATRFMMNEERHHVFVGTSGLERVLDRTCQLMKDSPNEDVRALGGLPLDLVQRFINFWYSRALDMMGSEISSNAANSFSHGLKGRYGERAYGDHRAVDAVFHIEIPESGRLVHREVALVRAMNEVLREAYIRDCAGAVSRWNSVITRHSIAHRLYLPHRRFNRRKGLYAADRYDEHGRLLSGEKWERLWRDLLPTPEDHAYLRDVMVPVREVGRVASWVAPPARGIDNKPLDWQYVRG